MDGIDGKWVREIYSDTLPSKRYKPLTFLGSYEHYYKRLSTNWNKATKAKYNQMINSTILPAIKDHNKKYIWQYVRQDYDDAMQTIISNGYKVSGERKEYSESYLATIRRILSTVVRYASQAMDFSNVLWGTVYDLPESVDSDVEKFLIKKSLTPLQEQLLLSALLRDIHAHGSAVGLLLMMALGVRDAEACGLNYGDIIPLETHADCMFARICKTTKIKSNKLQAGGKSINTGRYVYVPDVVYITPAIKYR